MGDNQLMQQMDMEQRERRLYEIAARLHMAMLDGYLTPDEFSDCLYEFGILSTWEQGRMVA